MTRYPPPSPTHIRQPLKAHVYGLCFDLAKTTAMQHWLLAIDFGSLLDKEPGNKG